jgi:uncharacterized protein (DUF2141 family)
LGYASIFAGQFVKLLKDSILLGTSPTARILTSTNDPTSVATLGEAGSILLKVSAPAGLYLKCDAGTTTNWAVLALFSLASDLSDIIENELQESSYQMVTKDVIAEQGTSLKDLGVSTTAYNQAKASEQFTANGQIYQTINLLDNEFLAAGLDIPSVDLSAVWDFATFPTSSMQYQVSRDGGVSFQTITMSRVGTTDTLQGSLQFADESTGSYINQLNQTSTGTQLELNTTTVQGVGPLFTIAAANVVKQITVYLNKVGSPAGQIYVQIVRAPGGAISTSPSDIVAQAAPILASAVGGSDTQFVLSVSTPLPAGTYAIVYLTDLAYKASFVTTTTAVRVSGVASGSVPTFNGTVWGTGTFTPKLTISGKALDLRVNVTATVIPSPATVNLKALAAFYNSADIGTVNGIRNVEVRSFLAVANNLSTFTLTKFLPDPDLLKVFHIETGQVYSYGAFTLNGYQVIFPANTFNNGGIDETTVTLRFEQQVGTSFDNNDKNVSLLTANHLGSTDASIDRSLAGRGVMLRDAAGTLRELVINSNDQVQVYSTALALVSTLVDSINTQTVGGAKTWTGTQAITVAAFANALTLTGTDFVSSSTRFQRTDGGYTGGNFALGLSDQLQGLVFRVAGGSVDLGGVEIGRAHV